MEPLLSGKKILITGGTSELGTAFVLKALEDGASVFFTHFRSVEKAKKLEASGARGFFLDLADKKSLDAFLERFIHESETLDILIHNAAIAADERIENLSEEDWDKVIAADLKAPFYLTKGLLPLLMRNPPNKIFMIVSQAGLHGLAGAANYAAAKGGLLAMMKSMAMELGRKKILVNAVNPGFMKSRLTENLSEKIIKQALDRSPLKALSDPREVAEFLAYLCSDLVKQVTGQVFHFESRSL